MARKVKIMSITDKRQLYEIMACLSGKEHTVIELMYRLGGGDRRTFKEVGDILGITRQRVIQIDYKALRKLRNPSRPDANDLEWQLENKSKCKHYIFPWNKAE